MPVKWHEICIADAVAEEFHQTRYVSWGLVYFAIFLFPIFYFVIELKQKKEKERKGLWNIKMKMTQNYLDVTLPPGVTTHWNDQHIGQSTSQFPNNILALPLRNTLDVRNFWPI